MRTEFLCISVRAASGPRVKLASCKIALTFGDLVRGLNKKQYLHHKVRLRNHKNINKKSC